MERKKMKRVNIILGADIYDKARAVAFVKRKSISEIVRSALGEWLAKNIDARTKLLLSEKDERKLLRILESEDFVPAEKAKKSLGLGSSFTAKPVSSTSRNSRKTIEAGS